MILRTSTGARRVESRSADSLAYALEQLGMQTRGAVAVGASERGVRGIPAFGRAAELKAKEIASLEMGVWRGDLPYRERAAGTWQGRLFRGRPNAQQTSVDFKQTIGTSLVFRSNAYVLLMSDPATGRVVEMWALHPDQVAPYCSNGRVGYTVRVDHGFVDPFGRGRAVYDVSAEQMVHLRDDAEGGLLVAPSRVERFAAALGPMVDRQQHEAAAWQNGARVKLAVEFPAEMPREKAMAWRSSFDDVHGGASGHPVMVLGGGAQVKPVGMTMRDAEFVASARLGVEECARIVGVPLSLLDSGVTPPLEQELSRWLRFGLLPELVRVEAAFNEHPALRMDRDRGVYFAFATETFVRGDVLTEAQVMHMRVQSGVLLADEARAQLGLDPLPDGLGQIPQIVPVGGAANPVAPDAAPPVADAPVDASRARLAAAVFDAAGAMVDEANAAAAAVRRDAAEREERARADAQRVAERDVVVNVPAPVVHVAPAEVVVNVDAPVTVECNHEKPEPKGPEVKTVTFAKDALGRIVGAQIIEEESD